MQGAREQYLLQGIDGYIAKPLDSANLHQEISRVLGCKQKQWGNQVDWCGAVELADGDEAMLSELLTEFLVALPDYLSQLQQQLDDRDYAALERTAHTLGGLCATFGMTTASVEAQNLHSACRDSADAADLHRIVRQLVAQIHASRAQLETSRQGSGLESG